MILNVKRDNDNHVKKINFLAFLYKITNKNITDYIESTNFTATYISF